MKRSSKLGLGLGFGFGLPLGLGLFVALGLTPAAGCSDEGEADSSTGAGGASSASVVGSSVASTSASSSSGTGGAAACLPVSATEAYFTLQDAELCVVAQYSATALDLFPFGVEPTWGRHGGPLTSTVMQTGTNADVHIERWSISGNSLTKTETVSTLANVSSGAFFGPQIFDLPTGASAISYTGQDFLNDGALVLTTDTTEQKSFLAPGVFGIGAVGPDADAYTRVLYTGLSAADMMPPSGSPALYALDIHADGTPVVPSEAIAPWGDSSGPVAVDKDGDVIAIETKFDGTQEIRGFEASVIQPLLVPTNGNVLLDTTGFGSALAAVAPEGTSAGYVAFQPMEGTGTHEDVISIRYAASPGMLTAQPKATLLTLAVPDTNITLMTDDQNRLWVGAENVSAGMGSVFFVISRKP
jgi:hypothetical protein